MALALRQQQPPARVSPSAAAITEALGGLDRIAHRAAELAAEAAGVARWPSATERDLAARLAVTRDLLVHERRTREAAERRVGELELAVVRRDELLAEAADLVGRLQVELGDGADPLRAAA